MRNHYTSADFMNMDLTKYYQGLSSQRFYYRKLTHEDIESWVVFYENNPNLKYLGINLNRTNDEMAKAWIDAQTERYEQNAFGQLGIVSKGTNTLVGTMGFKITPFCEEGEIEQAIAIKPDYWRQGIGKEATITLINAVFENNWVKAVIGLRHVENGSSEKFNHALGFKDIQTLEDQDRLVMKYKVTKVEWEQKRAFYYFNFRS